VLHIIFQNTVELPLYSQLFFTATAIQVDNPFEFFQQSEFSLQSASLLQVCSNIGHPSFSPFHFIEGHLSFLSRIPSLSLSISELIGPTLIIIVSVFITQFASVTVTITS
jgi:hypothetical protein